MSTQQLSTAEAEIYDRQIRLWGIESQEKLRAANVLLIGIKGLGSEIAKNILLSGINSLTILDDSLITQDDITHNFLLEETATIGKKIAEEVVIRAQALNPLVKIVSDTDSITNKKTDFFESYKIIVATTIKPETILKIDGICREHNIKFIYGDVFGYFGFSVADFQDHTYFEDRIQLTAGKKRTHSGEKKTVKIQGTLNYPPLNKVLILPNTKQDITAIKKSRPNKLFVTLLTLLEFRKRFDRNPIWEKKDTDITELTSIAEQVSKLYNYSNIDLNELYELLFGELPPVCAILGGVIAQEVIKAVSHKEATINNVFLFDPLNYSGKELSVGL